MDWYTFEERVFDWSESTRGSRISSLEDFGDGDEVTNVITAFEEEKNASKLIKKAVEFGVKFSKENIMDMLCCVDEDALSKAVSTVSQVFYRSELDELYLSVDNATYDMLEDRLYKYYDKRRENKASTKNASTTRKTYTTTSQKPTSQRRRPSSSSDMKKLAKSFSGMMKAFGKLTAPRPTMKEKLYRERAKRRRKQSWWQKY